MWDRSFSGEEEMLVFLMVFKGFWVWSARAGWDQPFSGNEEMLVFQWFSKVFEYGVPGLGSALRGNAGRPWFPGENHGLTKVFQGPLLGKHVSGVAACPGPGLLDSRKCSFSKGF